MSSPSSETMTTTPCVTADTDHGVIIKNDEWTCVSASVLGQLDVDDENVSPSVRWALLQLVNKAKEATSFAWCKTHPGHCLRLGRDGPMVATTLQMPDESVPGDNIFFQHASETGRTGYQHHCLTSEAAVRHLSRSEFRSAESLKEASAFIDLIHSQSDVLTPALEQARAADEQVRQTCVDIHEVQGRSARIDEAKTDLCSLKVLTGEAFQERYPSHPLSKEGKVGLFDGGISRPSFRRSTSVAILAAEEDAPTAALVLEREPRTSHWGRLYLFDPEKVDYAKDPAHYVNLMGLDNQRIVDAFADQTEGWVGLKPLSERGEDVRALMERLSEETGVVDELVQQVRCSWLGKELWPTFGRFGDED